MRYPVIVSITLLAHTAAAEPERFRVGSEAMIGILPYPGSALGVTAEVPVRCVAIRGRLAIGDGRALGGPGTVPPGEAARLWRATGEAEWRGDVFDDGSLAATGGVGLGVVVLHGGFLDRPFVAAALPAHLGFELRSDLVRFRAGAEVALVAPGTDAWLSLGFALVGGVDLAF